ncbi:hypothetical protein VMF7928_00059 [Vibrio marisflavi CECT 7928]|uniref:Solute-binding protein family 3/N-terminal domain-containing protein n=2 Tax=Vibrio marisflavi TaxID=1216040 RepID=A0ABN8DZ41_9VIBR|nr:hypothetical protein VMF7928_00059 [Vibrio marisflavi CECT 7928]
MTEDFPPFGYYDKNGKLVGAAVEIVQLLLVKMNHPDKIQVLPWSRAIRTLEIEPNHMLFAMAKTPEREPKFKWLGPILYDDIFLYQLSSDSSEYNNIEQAKKAKYIVVTRGFPEEKILEQLGFKNIHTAHTPSQALSMLMSGRVTMIASGSIAITPLLQRSNYPLNALKETKVKLFSTGIYIGLSKSTPDEIVQDWQIGLNEIKKSESYQNIMSKYFSLP